MIVTLLIYAGIILVLRLVFLWRDAVVGRFRQLYIASTEEDKAEVE